MAAAAWLHQARMGGPTPYFGEVIDKPRLGPPHAGDWDSARLHALLRHVRRAGILWTGLAAMMSLCL
jgi:adenosylcobinamide-phosphate synthase